MEKEKYELIDIDDKIVDCVMAIDLEEALDSFTYNKLGFYMVECDGERVSEFEIK